MAKEDLFLASGRSNNEYLGSVIPLFQTVSEGLFSETSPTYLCIVVHQYSTRVTNGSKPK
jgi:hypothetical protein